MFDLKQFASAMTQISEEKGISQERVLETIDMAIAAAYKKEYGQKGQIVRAKFNPKTGDVKFLQIKIVVEESMLKPQGGEGGGEKKKKKKKKKKKEGRGKKKNVGNEKIAGRRAQNPFQSRAAYNDRRSKKNQKRRES